MLTEFRDWTTWMAELYICWILTKEYFYDYAKDEEKRHKKTRTTKKTTSKPGGETVVEESQEVTEVMNQEGKQ